MADAGCVGILTTNGSPAMAPWGGTEKTVGANPWSVATPGGSHPPVVLDIANTGVARGKIYAAAQRGEQIPESWAFDADGVPDHRPPRRRPRAARADGRPQGLRDLVHDGRPLRRADRVAATPPTSPAPTCPDRRSRCGHLVLALRIDAVLPDADFDARIDDLIATTKAVPRAAGRGGDLLPRRDRGPGRGRGPRTPGSGCPDQTVADLRELGESCGVASTPASWARRADVHRRRQPDGAARPRRGVPRRDPRERPGLAARRARVPAVRRPPSTTTRTGSSSTRSTPTRTPSTSSTAGTALRRLARGRGPVRRSRAGTSTRSPRPPSRRTSRSARPPRAAEADGQP